ncbi:hypothetical protein JCM1840_005359 [Sporobolomyces johnsonii]
MAPMTTNAATAAPEGAQAPVPMRSMAVPLEASPNTPITSQPTQTPAMTLRGGGCVKDCLATCLCCCALEGPYFFPFSPQ